MKCEKSDGHERRHYRTKLAAPLLFALSCGLAPGGFAKSAREPGAGGGARVEVLPTPAPSQSQTPFLAAASDGLYLSWLEKTPQGHQLRVSRWTGRSFAKPSTVRASDRFFANWADFPSILPLGSGRLAAHWLEKSAPGTYDYDVWIAVSSDEGKSWTKPSKPHRDQTAGEHGFVSLVPRGSGDERGFAAVWLDGGNFKKGAEGNEMALRFTSYDGTKYGDDVLLDPRVCDCCQTAMAPTASGLFVAYRDRSPEEIRDIAFVRLVDGRWTAPQTLYSDDWHLTGCPVNGPQVASVGDHVVVTWFTASKNDPRVQLVVSENGGKSFSGPIRVDDGKPLGRVDVVLLGGDAYVSWIEKTEGRGAEVRARRIRKNGKSSESVVVARTGADRTSGFPRMESFDGSVFVSWTDSQRQGPSRVRLARVVPE